MKDSILTENFCYVLRVIKPSILTQLPVGTHAWPTAGYIAPELMALSNVGSECPTLSEKTDVFAFGSLCYEVSEIVNVSFRLTNSRWCRFSLGRLPLIISQ